MKEIPTALQNPMKMYPFPHSLPPLKAPRIKCHKPFSPYEKPKKVHHLVF